MTSITCSAPGCRKRVASAERAGCTTHHYMLPLEIRRALHSAQVNSDMHLDASDKWEAAVRLATDFWRDEINRALRRGL